jgi:hypothetical protein
MKKLLIFSLLLCSLSYGSGRPNPLMDGENSPLRFVYNYLNAVTSPAPEAIPGASVIRGLQESIQNDPNASYVSMVDDLDAFGPGEGSRTNTLYSIAAGFIINEIKNGLPTTQGVLNSISSVLRIKEQGNTDRSATPNSTQTPPINTENRNIPTYIPQTTEQDLVFQTEERLRNEFRCMTRVMEEYQRIYNIDPPQDISALSVLEMRQLSRAEESAANKRLIVNFSRFRRAYRALGVETN